MLQSKIKKRVTKYYNLVYPKIQYTIRKLKGDDVIYTYYYNTIVNFGDLLTPEILREYCLEPISCSINDAEIVVVGSNLQILPEDFSGYIVGSGLIEDISSLTFQAAKIMAVRGELTRERIGASSSTVLGDPGLLAGKLITERQKKQFLLGIVPHYVDKLDDRVQNIYHRYENDVLIIDVQRKPLDVISDIDKCEAILSSSLHGIVVADSLGIPNGWILLSEKVRGHGFKFYDYASAFGMKFEPNYLTGYENLADLINMTHSVNKNIHEIKRNLDIVFNELKFDVAKKRKQYSFH